MKFTKICLPLVLALCLILPLLPATAAGNIYIPDRFPDTAFRRYIKNEYDRDDDNWLTEEQALGVSNLPVYTQQILNLTGVEVFENLNTLDCGANQLSKLDLSQNKKLVDVWCYQNNIETLDVSGAADLRLLCCQNNRLTSLDLSGNPKLGMLCCEDNSIQRLNISANPKLLALVNAVEPCEENGVLEWVSEAATLRIDKDTELVLEPEEEPAPDLPATYKDSVAYYEIANSEATYVKPAKTNPSSAKVPDTVTVNGVAVPVTAIGPGAFRTNQKKLTKVTIGKNVKEIGVNAFFKCTKLKTVSGGANVEIIGGCAFQGCTKLTKFTIGAKVKEIGKKAFFKCSALKTITIKSKLLTAKTVGSSAFKGIKATATIKVPKAVKKEYTKWLLKKGVKKTMKIK